jgi:hypothetical protein
VGGGREGARWEVNDEVFPRAWRIDIRGEGSVTYFISLIAEVGWSVHVQDQNLLIV